MTLLYYKLLKPKKKYDPSLFILFLHGFMFSDIWERTEIIKFFDCYQCILVDMLGFGNSEKFVDIESNSRKSNLKLKPNRQHTRLIPLDLPFGDIISVSITVQQAPSLRQITVFDIEKQKKLVLCRDFVQTRFFFL